MREYVCFDQVTLTMTYKLFFIPAKGPSRRQVEDMLSDANNVAELFHENLKAKKCFPHADKCLLKTNKQPKFKMSECPFKGAPRCYVLSCLGPVQRR